MKKANINYLSIANNHIFDYGVKGFKDTKKNLQNNNITFSGKYHYPVIDKNGCKILLYAFNIVSLKNITVLTNKIIRLN